VFKTENLVWKLCESRVRVVEEGFLFGFIGPSALSKTSRIQMLCCSMRASALFKEVN
jgi:hypothetical protein